jgi:hypothetical protein
MTKKKVLHDRILRMHTKVLEVIAQGRLDQESKNKLTAVARDALTLSKELGEAAPDGPVDKRLLGKVFAFLTTVVKTLLTLRHGT